MPTKSAEQRAMIQARYLQSSGYEQVEVQCPSDLIAVADPNCVHQILTNYVGNAMKYGAEPIHDGYQIEEAAAHRNVSNIGAPDLIGSVDREATQKVRIDLVT